MPDQRGCTGKPLCQPSRPPHEYRPGIRPKDATDKEARPPRSRGRSVVVLYNSVRTHRSLHKDTPIFRPIHQAGFIRYTRSSARFTIITSASRFSVHTAGRGRSESYAVRVVRFGI